MQFNLKDKVVCVYDFGLFVDLAVKLAESFGKVYYFTEWQDDFSNWNEYKIATNLPNVERCHNFFDIVHECDLFVFPDVGKGDLQEYLKSIGKLVYGSGHAENIEIFRSRFNKLKRELGLPEIPCTEFNALSDMREFLKDKENVFIKIDTFRGAMETERFLSMKLNEAFLDRLEHTIGFIKDDPCIRFMVEEPISNAIEIGTDLPCVNGHYSDKIFYGIEIKGEAYMGLFSDFYKVPKPVKDVNDKLTPVLEAYGYTGGLSTEVRVTEDEKIGYFIDICCRSGNPPTACQMEILENLPEAIYGAAMGIVVQLTSKYKYACQLQIHSSWAEEEPVAIEFPEKYRQWVKLKHWTVKETEYGKVDYFIPNSKKLSSVAAVVGVGQTMDEANDMCKKIASTLKGKGLEYRKEALDEAKKEIEKMYKLFPSSKI